MAVDIGAIIEIVGKLIDLEAQIEEAVKSETNKRRKKKIIKAALAHDCDALRKLMFPH
jgi:hypothetical protein